MELKLEANALKTLVENVIVETMSRISPPPQEKPDAPILFREPDAARMLSLRIHQLRDERQKGRISYTRGPGKVVLYTRKDLEGYILRRRVEAQPTSA